MRICFTHAHPDDETLASGALIAHLVDAGHEVSVLTATRGERGEVVPGRWSHLAGTPQLEERRAVELAGALAVLGVTRHAYLGDPPARASTTARRYLDSGMAWIKPGLAGPAPNSDPSSLCSAELAEASDDVGAYLNHVGAELAISYADDGGYGHPDHVRLHHATVRACHELGIGFAALTAEGGSYFELDQLLPRTRQALQQHETQLTVVGDDVIHSGGQREAIRTSVSLTATDDASASLVSALIR